MIKVFFEGAAACEASANPGETLLALAQRSGQPLEGACGGQMACATCHVIIAAADFPRLPRAAADEEDMLDFASGPTRYSRLACQIVLSVELDGVQVSVPD